MDTLSIFKVFYSYIQRDKSLWSTKWYQNNVQKRNSVVLKWKIVFGFILLWHIYFSSFTEFIVMYHYHTQQYLIIGKKLQSLVQVLTCEIPFYVSCTKQVFATSIQLGRCSITVQVISHTKSVMRSLCRRV
jgi:hypothetical protein